MAGLLAALIALAGVSACTDGAGNGQAADQSPPGPPPQTSQATPEPTLTIEHRKVTTIRSKTVGVIANEPKYITAAVVGISSGGRASLSGTADQEPYRVMDVRDGQEFEIAGIPFHIEMDPARGEVTIYQLETADE